MKRRILQSSRRTLFNKPRAGPRVGRRPRDALRTQKKKRNLNQAMANFPRLKVRKLLRMLKWTSLSLRKLLGLSLRTRARVKRRRLFLNHPLSQWLRPLSKNPFKNGRLRTRRPRRRSDLSYIDCPFMFVTLLLLWFGCKAFTLSLLSLSLCPLGFWVSVGVLGFCINLWV